MSGRNFGSILKKLASIRIEGPINIQKQKFCLGVAQKLIEENLGAVVLIINSYGGSLVSAQAIADTMQKIRDEKRIPIYCFAEDFCFNSANLILTSGTKCYANKFTMIGDFGFASEVIDSSEMSEKHKIGKTLLSNNKTPLSESLAPGVSLACREQRQKLVDQSQLILKQKILLHRYQDIEHKNESMEDFERKILRKRIIDPVEAVERGLIDQVENLKEFKKKHFPYARLLEYGETKYQKFHLNLLHEFKSRINAE